MKRHMKAKPTPVRNEWWPAQVVRPPDRFLRQYCKGDARARRRPRDAHCVCFMPFDAGAVKTGRAKVLWASPDELVSWRDGLSSKRRYDVIGRANLAEAVAEAARGDAAAMVESSSEDEGSGASDGGDDAAGAVRAGAARQRLGGRSAAGSQAALAARLFEDAVEAAAKLHAAESQRVAKHRDERRGRGPRMEGACTHDRTGARNGYCAFSLGPASVFCVGDIVEMRSDGEAWDWESGFYGGSGGSGSGSADGSVGDDEVRLVRIDRPFTDARGRCAFEGRRYVREYEMEGDDDVGDHVAVDASELDGESEGEGDGGSDDGSSSDSDGGGAAGGRGGRGGRGRGRARGRGGRSRAAAATSRARKIKMRHQILRLVTPPQHAGHSEAFMCADVLRVAKTVGGKAFAHPLVRVGRRAFSLVEPTGDVMVGEAEGASVCALCSGANLAAALGTEWDAAANAPTPQARKRYLVASTGAKAGSWGPLLHYRDRNGEVVSVHACCAAVLKDVNMRVVGQGACNVVACVKQAVFMSLCQLCGQAGASLQFDGAAAGAGAAGAVASVCYHIPCCAANNEASRMLYESGVGAWLPVWGKDDNGTRPGMVVDWKEDGFIWAKGWILQVSPDAAHTWVLYDSGVVVAHDLRSGHPCVGRLPVGLTRKNDARHAGVRVRKYIEADSGEAQRIRAGAAGRGVREAQHLAETRAFRDLMKACAEGALADAEAAWSAGEARVGGAEPWLRAIRREPTISPNHPLLTAVHAAGAPAKQLQKGSDVKAVVQFLLAKGLSPLKPGYTPPRSGDGLRQDLMFNGGMSPKDVIDIMLVQNGSSRKLKAVKAAITEAVDRRQAERLAGGAMSDESDDGDDAAGARGDGDGDEDDDMAAAGAGDDSASSSGDESDDGLTLAEMRARHKARAASAAE